MADLIAFIWDLFVLFFGVISTLIVVLAIAMSLLKDPGKAFESKAKRLAREARQAEGRAIWLKAQAEEKEARLQAKRREEAEHKT